MASLPPFLLSLSVVPFLPSVFSPDLYFPPDFVPPPFTFPLSVITVIFFFFFSPLTRSDYTRPPLVITFSFKSTQPPDLPGFPLLFGSAIVIKMLPGSSSLLSKVSFSTVQQQFSCSALHSHLFPYLLFIASHFV